MSEFSGTASDQALLLRIEKLLCTNEAFSYIGNNAFSMVAYIVYGSICYEQVVRNEVVNMLTKKRSVNRLEYLLSTDIRKPLSIDKFFQEVGLWWDVVLTILSPESYPRKKFMPFKMALRLCSVLYNLQFQLSRCDEYPVNGRLSWNSWPRKLSNDRKKIADALRSPSCCDQNDTIVIKFCEVATSECCNAAVRLVVNNKPKGTPNSEPMTKSPSRLNLLEATKPWLAGNPNSLAYFGFLISEYPEKGFEITVELSKETYKQSLVSKNIRNLKFIVNQKAAKNYSEALVMINEGFTISHSLQTASSDGGFSSSQQQNAPFHQQRKDTSTSPVRRSSICSTSSRSKSSAGSVDRPDFDDDYIVSESNSYTSDDESFSEDDGDEDKDLLQFDDIENPMQGNDVDISWETDLSHMLSSVVGAIKASYRVIEAEEEESEGVLTEILEMLQSDQDKIDALRNVINDTVGDRESAVLLSPVGQGKSTFINLLLRASQEPRHQYGVASASSNVVLPDEVKFLHMAEVGKSATTESITIVPHVDHFDHDGRLLSVQRQYKDIMKADRKTDKELRLFCQTGDFRSDGFILKTSDSQKGGITKQHVTCRYAPAFMLYARYRSETEMNAMLMDPTFIQLGNSTYSNLTYAERLQFDFFKQRTAEITGKDPKAVKRLIGNPTVKFIDNVSSVLGRSFFWAGARKRRDDDRIYVREQLDEILSSPSRHALASVVVFAPCYALRKIDLVDAPGHSDRNYENSDQLNAVLRKATFVVSFLENRGISSSLMTTLNNVNYFDRMQVRRARLVIVRNAEVATLNRLTPNMFGTNGSSLTSYHETMNSIREDVTCALREELSCLLADDDGDADELQVSTIINGITIMPCVAPCLFSSSIMNCEEWRAYRTLSTKRCVESGIPNFLTQVESIAYATTTIGPLHEIRALVTDAAQRYSVLKSKIDARFIHQTRKSKNRLECSKKDKNALLKLEKALDASMRTRSADARKYYSSFERRFKRNVDIVPGYGDIDLMDSARAMGINLKKAAPPPNEKKCSEFYNACEKLARCFCVVRNADKLTTGSPRGPDGSWLYEGTTDAVVIELEKIVPRSNKVAFLRNYLSLTALGNRGDTVKSFHTICFSEDNILRTDAKRELEDSISRYREALIDHSVDIIIEDVLVHRLKLPRNHQISSVHNAVSETRPVIRDILSMPSPINSFVKKTYQEVLRAQHQIITASLDRLLFHVSKLPLDASFQDIVNVLKVRVPKMYRWIERNLHGALIRALHDQRGDALTKLVSVSFNSLRKKGRLKNCIRALLQRLRMKCFPETALQLSSKSTNMTHLIKVELDKISDVLLTTGMSLGTLQSQLRSISDNDPGHSNGFITSIHSYRMLDDLLNDDLFCEDGLKIISEVMSTFPGTEARQLSEKSADHWLSDVGRAEMIKRGAVTNKPCIPSELRLNGYFARYVTRDGTDAPLLVALVRSLWVFEDYKDGVISDGNDRLQCLRKTVHFNALKCAMNNHAGNIEARNEEVDKVSCFITSSLKRPDVDAVFVRHLSLLFDVCVDVVLPPDISSNDGNIIHISGLHNSEGNSCCQHRRLVLLSMIMRPSGTQRSNWLGFCALLPRKNKASADKKMNRNDRKPPDIATSTSIPLANSKTIGVTGVSQRNEDCNTASALKNELQDIPADLNPNELNLDAGRRHFEILAKDPRRRFIKYSGNKKELRIDYTSNPKQNASDQEKHFVKCMETVSRTDNKRRYTDPALPVVVSASKRPRSANNTASKETNYTPNACQESGNIVSTMPVRGKTGNGSNSTTNTYKKRKSDTIDPSESGTNNQRANFTVSKKSSLQRRKRGKRNSYNAVNVDTTNEDIRDCSQESQTSDGASSVASVSKNAHPTGNKAAQKKIKSVAGGNTSAVAIHGITPSLSKGDNINSSSADNCNQEVYDHVSSSISAEMNIQPCSSAASKQRNFESSEKTNIHFVKDCDRTFNVASSIDAKCKVGTSRNHNQEKMPESSSAISTKATKSLSINSTSTKGNRDDSMSSSKNTNRTKNSHGTTNKGYYSEKTHESRSFNSSSANYLGDGDNNVTSNASSKGVMHIEDTSPRSIGSNSADMAKCSGTRDNTMAANATVNVYTKCNDDGSSNVNCADKKSASRDSIPFSEDTDVNSSRDKNNSKVNDINAQEKVSSSRNERSKSMDSNLSSNVSTSTDTAKITEHLHVVGRSKSPQGNYKSSAPVITSNVDTKRDMNTNSQNTGSATTNSNYYFDRTPTYRDSPSNSNRDGDDSMSLSKNLTRKDNSSSSVTTNRNYYSEKAPADRDSHNSKRDRNNSMSSPKNMKRNDNRTSSVTTNRNYYLEKTPTDLDSPFNSKRDGDDRMSSSKNTNRTKNSHGTTNKGYYSEKTHESRSFNSSANYLGDGDNNVTSNASSKGVMHIEDTSPRSIGSNSADTAKCSGTLDNTMAANATVNVNTKRNDDGSSNANCAEKKSASRDSIPFSEDTDVNSSRDKNNSKVNDINAQEKVSSSRNERSKSMDSNLSSNVSTSTDTAKITEHLHVVGRSKSPQGNYKSSAPVITSNVDTKRDMNTNSQNTGSATTNRNYYFDRTPTYRDSPSNSNRDGDDSMSLSKNLTRKDNSSSSVTTNRNYYSEKASADRDSHNSKRDRYDCMSSSKNTNRKDNSRSKTMNRNYHSERTIGRDSHSFSSTSSNSKRDRDESLSSSKDTKRTKNSHDTTNKGYYSERTHESCSFNSSTASYLRDEDDSITSNASSRGVMHIEDTSPRSIRINSADMAKCSGTLDNTMAANATVNVNTKCNDDGSSNVNCAEKKSASRDSIPFSEDADVNSSRDKNNSKVNDINAQEKVSSSRNDHVGSHSEQGERSKSMDRSLSSNISLNTSVEGTLESVERRQREKKTTFIDTAKITEHLDVVGRSKSPQENCDYSVPVIASNVDTKRDVHTNSQNIGNSHRGASTGGNTIWRHTQYATNHILEQDGSHGDSTHVRQLINDSAERSVYQRLSLPPHYSIPAASTAHSISNVRSRLGPRPDQNTVIRTTVVSSIDSSNFSTQQPWAPQRMDSSVHERLGSKVVLENRDPTRMNE